MKDMIISAVRRVSLALLGTVLAASFASPVQAQLPGRLAQTAASTPSAPLAGTASRHLPGAQAMGHLSGETQLTRMTLVLQPSAAQQAELAQLLQDQQNSASPSYHQWLTPSQFGARFGVSDEDLAVLRAWLTARGLQVNEVPASRNAIVFSGTSSAVESAFSVSMQRYSRNGQQFFANSTDIAVPTGLAEIVGGVRGLSNYRLPAPQAVKKLRSDATVSPFYTTSSGGHYLVPWDFRQIFGLNTLINAGYDGTGIKIAVIGQSAVNTTQIGYFQTLTGQTAKTPTLVLVPNTGVSTFYTGDEGESEVDIEYAGGSAPGAAIQFVYTGSGNYGVFDALVYTIQNNLAPIITMSYGACENEASSDAATLEPYFQQANAQGETIVISSGDSGAASCDPASSSDATTFTVASQGLAVSYPASSPYVSGIGGTQLNSDSSTNWSASNNSYRGSAIGYMPEIAWNDTAAGKGVVSASGGGYSKLFGKPSWQTGTGVPSDGHRDIPDVSFPASQYNHGYLICSAEVTSSNGAPVATAEACTPTSFSGYVFGGTSLAAPNFAAMLALVEQANKSTGLGNLNASLYSFAAGASATSIFNDITSGDNIVPCSGGSLGCSSTTAATNGTMGYTTGTGYDQVTGLGSVNAPALQTALAAAATTASTAIPTVTLTASTTAPTVGSAITFSSSVTAAGSTATPTGTVTFAVDGTTVGSAVTLSSGQATYAYSGFTSVGSHTVTATYSGSTTYAAGSATLTLTASAAPAGGTGGITLTASPTTLTVTAGSSGVTTLTVTSVNGFAGSVGFAVAVTSGSLSSACYSTSNATVAANGAATSTLTIATSSAACASASGRTAPLGNSALALSARSDRAGGVVGKRNIALIALSAGMLCCFGLRRRTRLAGPLMAVLLSVLVLGMAGCGGASGTSTSTTTTTTTTTSAKGTYTLQVTATGTTSTTVGATTTLLLVVQ